MGGHEPDPPEAANLKGLARTFNSITFSGRANVAKATYAAIGLAILYAIVKPSKKK